MLSQVGGGRCHDRAERSWWKRMDQERAPSSDEITQGKKDTAKKNNGEALCLIHPRETFDNVGLCKARAVQNVT